MTDLIEPITVEVDVPITRRLKLHAVVDGNGEQIFHSRLISEVLVYLREHEVVVFTILDGDLAFVVSLSGPLAPIPRSKG